MVKNASVTLAMQVVKNVLAFISRTVFVYVLGAEYLGVNSLFTEILTVLSFAELGIGNAMVFSLYKPLATKNIDKIKSLMRLYARSYWAIGIVIAVLGVCVIPFLPYIVGDVSYVKENITLLYLLFLLNSVLSYFFVYKKSLIIADQRNYIVDIYQQIFYAIQVIAQSVFLIITRAFIPYLLIVVLCTFLNNYFVARKADKMYPYLRDRNVKPLGKTEIKDIVANIKALVVYKIGGIALESTTSIFTSMLINVVTVGLYNNYKMFVDVFRTIGNQVMNSIVASVGNLNAGTEDDKKERVFYEIFYLNAWFYGFAAMGLYYFTSPLITIWLGDSYLIGNGAVAAACLYFYISNMHYPCYTYRTTAGLFVFGKYVPIAAAVINLGLAFALGKLWGLTGILLASSIARILTYEIVDPIIICKRIFKKNALYYFVIYAVTAALIVADGYISYWIIPLLPITGLIGFIVKIVIFSIFFNTIFFAATFHTQSARSLINRFKRILIKNTNHGRHRK
ncbi:lipopolysaccharide biosynthesis protein [Bifidobacterium avesanii]|uniref:Oligosaccharide flippase family protein n=1 Tax=Bifidobacterium avesanii TaxID=1798157 RepID=A0A7K3TJ50_9BIFI|nr:hypothetical protein [Bifidobacterium avesanii]NEG78729.1 hypothetical protein [Bifidobacterium avesanii]